MNKLQLRLPINDVELSARQPAVWRPIHYLGSKLRIVEPLRLAIDQADPTRGPVCDLFAGSGTVSAALASSRDVIAVDIQEYSRVLCSAVLQPSSISNLDAQNFVNRALGSSHNERLNSASPLIEYEYECLNKARLGEPASVCELIDHASIVAMQSKLHSPVSEALVQAQKRTVQRLEALRQHDFRETLTLRYFGGLYFSYLQAAQLDSLLIAAHEQTGGVRDCLLAAIISAASEIVNSVGKHFAQPIRPRGRDGKPKRHLIGKILREREMDVVSLFSIWLDRYRSLPMTGRKHVAIRADFGDALASLDRKVGVVYADPPYTRDHYSRYYHVLETMCRWDNPGVSTTRIRAVSEQFSRGMYRADRHQSPFSIKSQAPAAFERLFAAVRDLSAPLVLSYSPYVSASNMRPRVMTVEQVLLIARKYFSRVETVSAGRISHMKLNTLRFNADPSYDAELIIFCS
jgi:adenine-specific DNA-methyltransferase